MTKPFQPPQESAPREHDNGSEWVECSTLDEAKAAAEAAVRETWT